MGRTREEKLCQFGEELEAILEEKNISQSALAEVSKVAPSIISDMMVNRNRRLTRNNVLRCIEGLIRLQGITQDYVANKLLRAASADRKLDKKTPLKELDEYNARDAAVIKLLELQKKLPSTPHADLAMQLIPLLGREQEIATLLRLLEVRRLITLTGAAGIGKTRLAWEVEHKLKDTPSFASKYISLAILEPHTSIISTIGLCFDVKDANILEEIDKNINHFVQQADLILLVIDNFEHVLEGPADNKEVNKQLITHLLLNFPKIRIIITSRTILNIEYEQVFPVPPLQIPSSRELHKDSDLLHYSATALFIRTLLSKIPTFSVAGKEVMDIVEICNGLAGLPLAIRIAASWAARLTLKEIHNLVMTQNVLSLTNDDFELQRQQTLFITFTWSYNLLDDEARFLFRSLALFVGGSTFSALEAVCRKKERYLQEVSRRLLDCSMVEKEERGGQIRLFLLRPVYEFARIKLDELKKEARVLKKRHTEYFANWSHQQIEKVEEIPLSELTKEPEYKELREQFAAENLNNAEAFLTMLRSASEEDKKWFNDLFRGLLE